MDIRLKKVCLTESEFNLLQDSRFLPPEVIAQIRTIAVYGGDTVDLAVTNGFSIIIHQLIEDALSAVGIMPTGVTNEGEQLENLMDKFYVL